MDTASSQKNSVPSAQASPASTQGTSPQSNNVQALQTQKQSIAWTQPPETNTGTCQQPPVPPQQQLPLLQPPTPGSHAAPTEQKQPSPFKQGFNPVAESFIPTVEAQPNAVPNTPEKRIPKSNGGQGVKSSTPNDKICFRCKQPGHLKKDCPELPYCSKCLTRGHIPARCLTRNQGNKQQDTWCDNGNQQVDWKCENWKHAQDQPQFSNPNNRCLHCTGDHRYQDCPMRHQHQVPPTNNPIGSTSIPFQYSPNISQPSPPQHSQQSLLMDGSSTPLLMVNNP